MTAFESAVNKSVEEGDIDLILPPLLETTFYMVCDKELDDGEQDIILVESQDEGQLCITVAESRATLEPLLENNPDVVFTEIKGDELLAIVRDEHEILVLFGEGGYYITRDQIEWWYEEMHDNGEEDAEGDDEEDSDE